jgi:CRP-like cAMP-binding protein/membrane protein YdbS with pleckstrin-like domain
LGKEWFVSPQEKADYLGELEIFAELEDDELAALALITSEYEFDEQATIAYQRDIADEFFIVVDGRIFVSQVDAQGVVRGTRSFFPGQYFGDLWLFEAHAHPATVQGGEAGRILTIRREDFLRFLLEYDEAVDYLNLSEEAQDVVEQLKLGGEEARPRNLSMTTEEQILFWERRSVWRLILEISIPTLLFLGWTAFILGYGSLPGFWATVVILAPGLLAGLIVVWRTLDWTNDYFVITNKHLVHHEYSLRGFQVVVIKVPIDQVQSVEIEKPSLLATILGVGTAVITTASVVGSIRFDWIDDPQEVADIINRQREQAKEVDAGQTQAALRAALEQHYQSDPVYRRIDLPADDLEDDDQYDEDGDVAEHVGDGLRGGLWRIGQILGTRLVDGDVITYRKHPFTLFVRTWWLWLIFFAVLVIASWLQDAFISSMLALLAIFFLLWITWRYLDWRNDLFQVTNRYILDIDRLPLGFGESRKQAELGNVQNVNASRPGFLPTIFNFGNVTIETAGASPDIVFEKVSNPSRVQSDVFEKREAFLARQRTRDREQRRKEFAVMLDVYQQAQESGRIPRRMPPPQGETPPEEAEEV